MRHYALRTFHMWMDVPQLIFLHDLYADFHTYVAFPQHAGFDFWCMQESKIVTLPKENQYILNFQLRTSCHEASSKDLFYIQRTVHSDIFL